MEITYIDPRCNKSEWPKGAWDDEPDKVQWKDESTGMDCLAKRNPRLGYWCGYVGVGPDHSLYKKNYGDVDIEVHGCLTFSADCQKGPPEQTVCHIPEKGEPEHLWWFGFDCAHSMDKSPNQEYGYSFDNATYKTLGYVKNQCKLMAEQLRKM